MPVAHLDDIDLYYELHGVEDGPPILNIGGTGGDLRRTFPDRLPLNRSFRVLSFDQRGLGQSGVPPGEYTMTQYADDAAALIRHAGWERAHVVGTSFGGMVALNLAVRHPSLIERLVLNCTSPGGEYASYKLQHLAELDPDVAFETRMRLFDRRWDPGADEPIPGMGRFYDVIAQQARAAPDPEQTVGLIRQLGARDGHDVVDDLGTIAHETLVCAGRHDGLAPLANSELLVERMPNATLQVFDGGHFFPLQDRSAYPAAIEFLLDSSS